MGFTAKDIVAYSASSLPDLGEYDPEKPRMNIPPQHIASFHAVSRMWKSLVPDRWE